MFRRVQQAVKKRLVERSSSGLVLALIRALMAALFVLWLAIAPPHPAQNGLAIRALFGCYLGFALAVLVIAWRSWWFEFRLQKPAFVIDVMTLLVGLSLTEAVALDFYSPFMTFFAFVMLTSAARWRLRSALVIAGVLALLFLADSVLAEWAGIVLEPGRVARRFGTLALMLLMFLWFALDRPARPVPRCERMSEDTQDPLATSLAFAMGAYRASRGWIAWIDAGSPEPRVLAVGMTAPVRPSCSPEPPSLFDRRHGRAIRLDPVRGLRAEQQAGPAPVETPDALVEGLSIALANRTGHGRLCLGGIIGLNTDDLLWAEAIAREIATTIDEEASEALAREVALSRLRSRIATDLHDSVVQTLAGMRFHLEVLRSDPSASQAMLGDIDRTCASLSEEQDHVRAVIAQLRDGHIEPGLRDLRAELALAARQAERQWGVAVNLADTPEPIACPTALVFEIHHLLREATANAVRHGQARALTLALARTGPWLRITIEDDGCGFPDDQATIPPRSIAERVARLHGTLTVTSRPGHCRLVVTLPTEPSS